MNEFAGPESFQPSEGATGAPEQLSEQAKQRFQAAQAAMQQIRAEEKRSRKRDDQVARTIVQFLGGDESSPFFLLISQLVARNCPSIFILAVLSLKSDAAAAEVDQYLKEFAVTQADTKSVSLPAQGALPEEVQRSLLDWIVRMRGVMAVDARAILLRLLVDERNIDGTVLQLTTFVLRDHFAEHRITLPYDELRVAAVGFLQAVFEPFLDLIDRRTLKARDDESSPDANT